MSSSSTPSSNQSHHSSPPPCPEEASQSESQSALKPVMIAVMGATGSGKSSFINLASGSNLVVGSDLDSCTAEIAFAGEFTLDGRPVILVDTPGFDDTTESDLEILRKIAAFLTKTYEEGFKLSGVIYIHRISDVRFTGASGKNLRMFRKLCGAGAMKNVILVTNMWGDVSPEVGPARENQLSSKHFKPALDDGAHMVRHNRTPESAHDIIRKIMKNHPAVLRVQKELVDERKGIADTEAGEAAGADVAKLIKKHEAEIEGLREDMAQALKEKDEQAKQDLEKERRILQEQIEKIRKDSEEMDSRYAAEREKMAVKLAEVEKKAEEERRQARADRDRTEKEAREERARVEKEAREERARVEKEAREERVRMEQEAKAHREKLEKEAQGDRNRAKADRDRMEKEAKAHQAKVDEEARAHREKMEKEAQRERDRVKADRDRMEKEAREAREARVRIENEAKGHREKLEKEAKAHREKLEKEAQAERDRAKADRVRMEKKAKANQAKVDEEAKGGIPIYLATGGENGHTIKYPPHCKVSTVRVGLIETANRDDGTTHIYVEAIPLGAKEGKFLDDPKAHSTETIEEIEKLVYWTHHDLEREAEAIADEAARRITNEGILKFVPGSDAVLAPLYSKTSTLISSVETGVFSNVVGRHMHYQHLLSVRKARDALKGHSGGVTGAARVVGTWGGNHLRAFGDFLGGL